MFILNLYMLCINNISIKLEYIYVYIYVIKKTGLWLLWDKVAEVGGGRKRGGNLGE